MTYTKSFKELNKNDSLIAGGKGASLGEMAQAGLLVPNGFVILSNAFERFLEETDLNVEIEAILHEVNTKEIHTVENASEKIKGLILHADIPQDIQKIIVEEFKNLDSKYVAVRSSATAEDGKDHAWAGQLESYLNTTEAELLEKVRHCWASLFTPRAIFYRFEKGLHNTQISVAVVVQKMIDSYVVEKEPRNIFDININTQTKGLFRNEKSGNEWRDIPEPKASSQVLSKEKILKLSEIILEIEKHYGFPCDIEWAYEQERFYILQSRPITTLQ